VSARLRFPYPRMQYQETREIGEQKRSSLTIDHANIVRFDETNPIQKPILDNEVWFRSALVQGAAAQAAKSGKKRKRASLVMNSRKPMPSVSIKVIVAISS